MNDVKLDAYNLTYKTLLAFYSGQELIHLDDFKKFFIRFESYFPDKDDVKAFLREICLIEVQDGMIDLRQVAMLVRNSVDLFPK